MRERVAPPTPQLQPPAALHRLPSAPSTSPMSLDPVPGAGLSCSRIPGHFRISQEIPRAPCHAPCTPRCPPRPSFQQTAPQLSERAGTYAAGFTQDAQQLAITRVGLAPTPLLSRAPPHAPVSHDQFPPLLQAARQAHEPGQPHRGQRQ